MTLRRPIEQPSGDSVGGIIGGQGAHVIVEEGCPPQAAVHPWGCCQGSGSLEPSWLSHRSTWGGRDRGPPSEEPGDTLCGLHSTSQGPGVLPARPKARAKLKRFPRKEQVSSRAIKGFPL